MKRGILLWVLLLSLCGCGLELQSVSDVLELSEISDVEEESTMEESELPVESAPPAPEIPEPQPPKLIVQAVPLPGTGNKAAFQVPDTAAYEIRETVYDEVRETYVVLYATTNRISDERPLFYNGKLLLQQFDSEGRHLQTIQTGQLPAPSWMSAACALRDGRLTYLAGNYDTDYVFHDLDTGEVETVPARAAAADGELFALLSTENSIDSRFLFHLYEGTAEVASVPIQVDDNNLTGWIEFSTEVRFVLDAATRTAQFGNDKITYTIDFAAGTWSQERHYQSKHLEALLDTSPDGRHEAYRADSGHFGDSIWADIVSKDTETGAVRYLATTGMPCGAAYDNAGRLLINRVDSLQLVDTGSGEVLNEQFGLDCAAEDCFVNGVAFDSEREWFLVASRSPKVPGDYDAAAVPLPLTLHIYDTGGGHVRSLDTGLTVPSFQVYWVVGLDLQPDGAGNVQIRRTNGEETTLLGTVAYA